MIARRASGTTNDGHGEQGSAMVVTLLVMAVLTGLGAIVFNVGLANLQNTGRDRLAGGALGASEGGVAEALQFIRTNGTSTLKCDEPPIAGTDCTKDWGKGNKHTISLPNGRQYKVWIQRVQKFNPPAVKQGTFLVHSEGTAGVGPGKRNVRVRVIVKPLEFPIGIYADDMTNGGSSEIRYESVFTKGCITQREKLLIYDGPDPYYNIPASAHSAEYITKSQSTCASNDRNNIHSQPDSTEPGECNPPYKNDQDALGGPLTDTEGAPCLGTPLQYDGYPQTSKFTVADLSTYGYKDPRGLTLAEYAQLKSKAQEQNNFYTGVSFTTPDDDNAVMYFDLRSVTGDRTVNIQTGNGPGQLGENWTNATCGTKSLVIVVEGGNLKITSNSSIVGALFVPDGTYSGAGTIKIIGTLFAKEIKPFGGNSAFTLRADPPADPNCFFDNFPGGLLSVDVDRFQEIDR